MGKLKRFCMIAFVIAAVLGVGVLAVLWFAWEPLLSMVMWFVYTPWFFVVEAVLLGITALGLLVVLIRAIITPGRHSRLEVRQERGHIAITQNAIQSTVRHVIENHRGLIARSVKVRITGRREPRITVRAKIDPGHNARLGDLGIRLQDEISASLESFTGYPTDSVHITFYGTGEAVTPPPSKEEMQRTTDDSSYPTQPIPVDPVQ